MPAARLGSLAVSEVLLQAEVTVNAVDLSTTVGLVPDGQNPDPVTVISLELMVALLMVTGVVVAKVGTVTHSNSDNHEATRFMRFFLSASVSYPSCSVALSLGAAFNGQCHKVSSHHLRWTESTQLTRVGLGAYESGVTKVRACSP